MTSHRGAPISGLGEAEKDDELGWHFGPSMEIAALRGADRATVRKQLASAISKTGGDAGVPASERLDGQNVDIHTTCTP